MKPYHTGIIFVHGIQGGPDQFRFLTEGIPRSVLVRNILLPGHGVDVKEYRKATAEQWLEAVRNACVEVGKQCERVLFVGHSMGCLLGLPVEREQRLFSGMLLLCCPFYVRPTWRYMKNNFLAMFTKGHADDPFVLAARNANSVTAKHAVSYLFCSQPTAQLFRLIRAVRKQDLEIPEGTVFCFCDRDEIVSKKSVLYAQSRLGASTVILSGCGHNYFTPSAQKRLIDALIEGLNKRQEEN